ncbi:hypothetical protein [Enterococcus sp. CWB-B31]|uniref:hypothetical protein n=1 Tax=Enterococcus sp. CWB-B31 TaxID=2885159 RepID=UPI001E506912|nr:hypothetical protein [Enterococcus sp. CWB-B31]MCB5954238.1 hypothetical protein [Enterococcus sp. CWB-B31]
MSLYQSRLEKSYQKRNMNRYSRPALERLTTLQLRDICYKEKLVKGIANSLDRDRFIETILHFRGLNEDTLIQNYDSAGFSRVEKLVDNHLGEELSSREMILNPAKLTVYKGLSVEPRDQYIVETSAPFLQTSNVLLVNDQKQLCGIFTLRAIDDTNQTFVLCMDKSMPVTPSNNKVYHLLYFKALESEYLFDIYTGNERLLNAPVDYYDVPLLDLEIAELPVTKQILAIDFGTSNSTAGVYMGSEYEELMNAHELLNGSLQKDQINYVQFETGNQLPGEWSSLLPSAVSVESCHPDQPISYCFGYQALSDSQFSRIDDHFGTTFYELKRWVHSYDQKEQLVDLLGNKAEVTRGSIIQAFIEYMIQHAEQQFKCRFVHLHVSSPVKMKHQFISMFQELFPAYQIDQKHALDEGISVLYNTISSQIDQRNFLHGEEYQALIFDCGGGTTDMSSCVFKIEDSRVSYRVTIQTTFENGDVNFGGNNLTYRILQFLKIRFAAFYMKEPYISVDEWFPGGADDGYRAIDEFGVQAFYQRFEALYEEVEEILPTQFCRYKNQNYDTYKRVQNNYYFLWKLAEAVKHRFYDYSDSWQLSIGASGLEQEELLLGELKGFKLSVRKNNLLDYVYQIPELHINRNEMNSLIKGDIYSIVKKFFEDLYENQQLQDFSIIKMTGQSCKIPLFREALKEFIAGKNIEFRQKKDNALMELKLSCLNGSIRYLEDCKTAIIRPKLINAVPEIPYTVYAADHHGETVQLLLRNDKITQVSGFISKDHNVREVRFFLRSEEQEVHTSFLYQNELTAYVPVAYQEINSSYTRYIRQDDVDNIEDEEVKFFVYANENNWGFYVLPITRLNGNLLRGEEQYFPFENESWEINFFDGMK